MNAANLVKSLTTYMFHELVSTLRLVNVCCVKVFGQLISFSSWLQ